MGTGYVRNDTGNNIADGNVINASDLDGEFDAIVAAFDSSSGHTHDGTSEEGAPITKFGPSQEVEGDASALFPASDGVTDLGKSTKEWKDLYIDGVINTDNISADAATVTGNAEVGGLLNVGLATTLTGTATLANLLTVSATSSFKGAVSVESTLAVTGETNVSDISASGTLDVAGETNVSDISASGTLDVAGETNLATATITGNISANGTLDVSGNGSVGGTFNVEGDLKNSAGNLTIAATSYIVEVKGGGATEGQIQLNCAANSHGQIIRSQPHSESVTNEMLLPKGANSTLVSEVGTATVTNKTLDGVVSISSTGTLNVAGETSLGNVSADGTLDASGNASVGGTLAVTGDTDVSNLSASGTFDVGGNASVGGTLVVTGDTDITNLSANGTLDVSGNGSVGGSFTVNTTITSGSSVSDSKGDLRTVPKAAIYADDFTLNASNAGKYVVLNSSGVSLTIPASTFGEGDVVTVLSTDGATASISSNITSFIAAGVSAIGTMALEPNGVANILFTSASFAILTGNIS